MPSPPGSLSRRAVVLAALGFPGLGLSALTGCSDMRLNGTNEQPNPSADATAPSSTATPAEGTDAAALAQLRTELGDLEALVAATLIAHPRLRAVLTPCQQLYADHGRVLALTAGDSAAVPSPDGTNTPTAAGRPARALTQVRTAQADYALHLLNAAGAAAGPALARALASMGAGATQHHARLATLANLGA